MNRRVCPYERRGHVPVHDRLPVNGPRLSIVWGDLSLTGVDDISFPYRETKKRPLCLLSAYCSLDSMGLMRRVY